MEGRAHSSKTRTLQGTTSRIVQDLAICSQNFVHDSRLGSIKHSKNENTGFSGKRHSQPHVGIVGAGLAGLRCAEVLIKEGIEVTLVEARDRIGGRIHQIDLLDRPMDMGPNWIHGTEGNPILRLARDTGSKLASPKDRATIYDSQGNPVGSSEVSTALQTIWNIIDDAFTYSSHECENIASHLSLKDFFQEKLLLSSLDKQAQEFVLELAEIWGGCGGDPLEWLSLKWFWLEECFNGDNLFLANTHQAIIKRVSEPVLNKCAVHLSTIVQSIETHFKSSGTGTVAVNTTNGALHFDEVVVTVPLGCLQMGTLTFLPELPPTLSRAIAGASYGHLEKAYMAFPTAFWDSQDSSIAEGEEREHLTENPMPVFSYFLHPKYTPKEQWSWMLDMEALSSPTVFGAEAQPVLLFNLWGTAASHTTSAIANLEMMSEDYYNIVSDLFRPFYSRLPNYKEGHSNCIPTKVLVSNWQNDEFAGKGSYTNFQTPGEGTDAENLPAVDEGVREMRKGVPERGLWFAGEHTAPLVALGTSSGAYWSGEIVASKIINAHCG